jgi:hypothetical protein
LEPSESRSLFSCRHTWPFWKSERTAEDPADVQQAARAHSADAIKTLSDIMNNPKAPAAARIAAASALLDRGYGKPLQTVDANNTNVNYVDV